MADAKRHHEGAFCDISREPQLYRLASADFQHRVCAVAGVVVMTSPGEWLRGLREELHLTRMAVERLTSEIARSANDERYRIRRGRLADMEDDKAAPDILEAQSLSKCYKVTYPAILQAFGVRLEDSEDMPQGAAHPHETTQQWSFADADRPFSLTFQSNISFDKTRLVTASAEELGVPAIVCQRLDAGQFRLGI